MGAPSTMVVHVAPRGKDMGGLLRYLYGPGKANEHTRPRAVAAANGLDFAFAGALSKSEASEFGRVLETSWREVFAEQNALAGVGHVGVSRQALVSGVGPVSDEDKEHVYHLIASLPPGAMWSDEQWAQVAQDLVEGMGFTSGPEDDNGCRWVAVRHGLSVRGNDHLHIAVNLVRQDGRRMSLPRNDYELANDARRAIEARRDFVLPLRDASLARASSLPAYSMAEHAAARRQGQEIPDRVLIQQLVRSAATAAATEAEWLEAVLDAPGVEIEPARWGQGGRERVEGYRVRIGEGRWFTATELASDLTLGRLRPAWEANETEQSRADALRTWTAGSDLPPVAAAGQVSHDLDSAEAALREWAGELQAGALSERSAWDQTGRQLAGVASALSRTEGPHRVVLTDVAQTLSRQALHVVPERGSASGAPRTRFGPSQGQLCARHVQLALRAGGPDSHPGWIAVLQQMQRLVRAMESARRARGELVSAQQLAVAQQRLGQVTEQLHAGYVGHDLDTLREARRAREASLSPGAQRLGRTGSDSSADLSPGVGSELRRRRGR